MKQSQFVTLANFPLHGLDSPITGLKKIDTTVVGLFLGYYVLATPKVISGWVPNL